MPIRELSVREQPTGGEVAAEVRPRVEDFHPTSSRIVMLIHGYNNTQADAREKYTAFLENVGHDARWPAGDICQFFWPGDADWGSASAAAYPFMIATAKQSAELLGAFLDAVVAPGGWPLEIVLVCHSLGNRLALDLTERNSRTGGSGVLFRAGCLMAAAVPVAFVETGGSLRTAAQVIRKTLVMHSAGDAVLHFAFPPGETAAGEGFLPRAVGRFGEPSAGLWGRRADMTSHGFDHGTYWTAKEGAQQVAEFLGIARERSLGERSTNFRELPPNVEVLARRTPRRRIGGGES